MESSWCFLTFAISHLCWLKRIEFIFRSVLTQPYTDELRIFFCCVLKNLTTLFRFHQIFKQLHPKRARTLIRASQLPCLRGGIFTTAWLQPCPLSHNVTTTPHSDSLFELPATQREHHHLHDGHCSVFTNAVTSWWGTQTSENFCGE